MANELRQLVDKANAPIFGIDVEGLVNEWNDKTVSKVKDSIISLLTFFSSVFSNSSLGMHRPRSLDILDKKLLGIKWLKNLLCRPLGNR